MKKLIPIIIALFSASLFAQDASVVSNGANLREGPSMSARVVKVLPRGTKLSFTDKKGNWNFVRSDKHTGWIHSITLRFTEKSGHKPITTKKPETGKVPIKAVFVGEIGNPTLKITNNSQRKVELVLGGVLYEIAPRSEKNIELKRGSYEYTLSSDGVPSVSGVKKFDKKQIYTWAFNVVEN